MAKTTTYPAESVGSILSTNVLTIKRSGELKDVLKAISDSSWDDIQYVYVVDENKKLEGIVDLARFPRAATNARIEQIMYKPRITLHPQADQEKAVLLAIEYDVTAVPVVDKAGVFLGVVTPGRLIDVMHQEHLEDALLSSGIRGHGSHILKLATSRYGEVIQARAPWLIFGAAVGLGLGLISSFFEATLEKTVAVAYFVPVVAYIADSVGTQSEAITVRALATLKIKDRTYLFRELIVGVVLGATLGSMGAVGALVISQSADIALVVGLSLFAASAIACVMASTIPIVFKRLGKDPALGSGPLSTAIQDVLSVLIYFLFARLLL